MMDVVIRFGPYIMFGLVTCFVLGGFIVAALTPRQSEPRRQIIFIVCMASAALCGLALFGCLMIWWESL